MFTNILCLNVQANEIQVPVLGKGRRGLCRREELSKLNGDPVSSRSVALAVVMAVVAYSQGEAPNKFQDCFRLANHPATTDDKSVYRDLMTTPNVNKVR
jgi:hypothetical protein